MITATDAGIRAGDRDREKTASLLGQALAQGYLAMPEYEDRLQAAFGAHTKGELQQLLADLPLARLKYNDPRHQAARRRAARRGVQIHVGAYLAGAVLMLAIWLAVAIGTGEWYFWPIWPILGWGIGVASHVIPVFSTTSCRPRTRRRVLYRDEHVISVPVDPTRRPRHQHRRAATDRFRLAVSAARRALQL